jgi:transcription termination factor NusB
MSGNSSKQAELQALMEQALEKSIELQKYSDEHFDVFLSGDDSKITEVINNREKMIEALIGIEYKGDIILDAVEEYDYGQSLPPDTDEIRQAVRAVLGGVSTQDMEIMKLISNRMQMYKIETLKARNKKNISSYMRTAFSDEPGDSVDFSK